MAKKIEENKEQREDLKKQWGKETIRKVEKYYVLKMLTIFHLYM